MEKLAFDIEALGAVLLHEIGFGNGLLGRGLETQALHGCAGCESDLFHRRPLRFNRTAERGFRARRWIASGHVETTRKEGGSPARADDTGPHDRDVLDGICHSGSSLATKTAPNAVSRSSRRQRSINRRADAGASAP